MSQSNVFIRLDKTKTLTYLEITCPQVNLIGGFPSETLGIMIIVDSL